MKMVKIKEKDHIKYIKRRMLSHPEIWKSTGMTAPEYIKSCLEHPRIPALAKKAYALKRGKNKRMRFHPNEMKDKADLVRMRLREKLKKP